MLTDFFNLQQKKKIRKNAGPNVNVAFKSISGKYYLSTKWVKGFLFPTYFEQGNVMWILEGNTEL